jgi:hypothetical protein
MAKVKFSVVVKYNGELISANTPFDVPAEYLADVVASGATVIEGGILPPPSSLPEENKSEEVGEDKTPDLVNTPPEELSKFAVEELLLYAKERGIEIPAGLKKAEIFNTIVLNQNKQ